MESVWSVPKLSTESVGSRRELVANCVHTADAALRNSTVASRRRCVLDTILFERSRQWTQTPLDVGGSTMAECVLLLQNFHRCINVAVVILLPRQCRQPMIITIHIAQCLWLCHDSEARAHTVHLMNAR